LKFAGWKTLGFFKDNKFLSKNNGIARFGSAVEIARDAGVIIKKK
jgi:hypothetical protein